LRDTAFCWEGSAKEATLSQDDSVGIPEVVEYAYGVLAYSIVSEYKEGSFSIQAVIGFGYINKDLIERFACTSEWVITWRKKNFLRKI